MPQRRFLIATSLARLIGKEQGVAGQVSEGYFPAHPHRDQFVSLEPRHCYLVLATTKEGAEAVERTELPRSQAEALLAVCAGEVTGVAPTGLMAALTLAGVLAGNGVCAGGELKVCGATGV